MESIINQTPKGTSLRGTMPFDVLSVKIGATVTARACWKNPQMKKNEKKKPSKDNFTYTGVKNP